MNANHTFPMAELFGSFLADGDLANRFRFCEVEPALAKHDAVFFDFAGVEDMTDSFVNACFGTLAEEQTAEFTAKVRFQNCTPLVKHFLSSAVRLGRQRGQRLVA